MGPPARITRYPYVEHPAPNTVVVSWHTDVASIGAVEYGSGAPSQKVSGGGARTKHSVSLTGLTPGTTYQYRVLSNGAVVTGTEMFSTRPTGSVPFNFVVFGDSGAGSEGQFAVASLMESLNPDFILHTGDVIYVSGEEKHYDPRFFVPYRDIIKKTVMYLTIGNHDIGGTNAAPYLENFHLPMNNPEGTERYYSFDYGDAHIVALFVQPGQPADYRPGSAQYAWLESDLSSTARKWKFVFFHSPPYASWYYGSDTEARTNLSPLFEEKGVDIVFTGHAHNYERTTPRVDFGPGGQPVTYVVTGGGGAMLSNAGTSDFTAYSESTYHAVEVKITGGFLELRALRADASVMDTFTKQK